MECNYQQKTDLLINKHTTLKVYDKLQELRYDMEANGLLPGDVIGDGQIHRCGTADKPQSQNGWYIAHADHPVSGAYGNWRTGESWNYSAKGDHKLTPEESDRLKARMESDKKKRQEEKVYRHSEAKQKAKAILAVSKQATVDHPYLVAKGIAPVGNIRIAKDGRLLIPVVSAKDGVVSLQFIAGDGEKRFLTGGQIQGCFFFIPASEGMKNGNLYICEGFATGVSIHTASGGAVLVAFSVDNLLPVAKIARERYPERQIVICADNDHAAPINYGIAKATEAACKINATLTVPKFCDPTGKTDFNDLATAEGLEVVKKILDSATPPAPVQVEFTEPECSLPIEHCTPVRFDSAVPPPIPPEIVPGILQDFCQAQAEALQVPFELVLTNALGVVAVAAQGKFEVAVKKGYSEPLNLYALCPLPPGERKSATVEACKAPLTEWQAAKREEMRNAIREAESERKTLEKAIEVKRAKAAQASTDEERREMIEEIKAMERELPEVLSAPRLLADDFTPEALATLMEQHNERIGLLEAEGGIFDTLAGRYSNGIPNLDAVLKFWSGEPCQIDRRGREPIFLKKPLLTMVISPQPEIVQGLASKPGFRGRGLIGRFLFVMPQSRLGKRSVETKPVPITLIEGWQQCIHRLLAIPWALDENGDRVAFRLELDQAAYRLWCEFSAMVEAELRPGGQFEHMTDWGGKFPGQAIRLAGLFHVATASDPVKQAIGLKTMESALSIAAILAEHAQAAYGRMGSDPAQECAQAILQWIERDRVMTFTARDALRAVRGRYSTMEKVNSGLAILEDRGFVFATPGEAKRGPGRKPSTPYTVNPRIWEG